MPLKRDFELWNIKQSWDWKTMGTFEVGLNAFLHYDAAISLWGPGSKTWWFEQEWLQRALYLNALGVWHSEKIRRCGLVEGSVSLGEGFEVSKAKPGPVSLFLMLVGACRTLSSFSSTMSVCICHADNGLHPLNCKPQLNALLYNNCCGHGVPSEQ